MYEYGIRIQNTEPIKSCEFLPCEIVDSFTCMHDKGAAFRCDRMRLPEIAAQRERVRPSILLNDPDGKIFSLQIWPKLVVVADRRDPAEKIPYATPPEAHIPGH
jgi:hypothetical protein